MKFFDLFSEHAEVPGVKYPETAQDGGIPPVSENMHAEYFAPDYPHAPHTYRPVGVLPQIEHKGAHFAGNTLETHETIPYIGQEPHGIEIDPLMPVEYLTDDVDLIKARGHAYGVGQRFGDPIAVYDVPPPLFGVEHKFSTNQVTLAAATPVMLSGRRLDRTLARVIVTVGTVTVAPSVADLAVGFIMPVGAAIVFNTNQPIWVQSTGAATVSVVEEFAVWESDKRL